MKDIFPPLVEWGMEKGMIVLFILSILSEREYERHVIRHEILRRFNKKVSPSGLLLILNTLRALGYIERKNFGRIKTYSVTEKGRRVFERGLNHLKSLVEKLEKRL